MITRTVTTMTANSPASGICLDCPKCQGSCWTAFELATVPPTVLKSKGK
ncbi:hypothetical protein QQG91_02045 [Marivivens sp. LCG002]|nr:hypothetical protein [Marivivens sp. LCG002]WIV51246.1 hypothetical protein QQG91_02045 [Marivivens sp. LCG002]